MTLEEFSMISPVLIRPGFYSRQPDAFQYHGKWMKTLQCLQKDSNESRAFLTLTSVNRVSTVRVEINGGRISSVEIYERDRIRGEPVLTMSAIGQDLPVDDLSDIGLYDVIDGGMHWSIWLLETKESV